MTTTTLLLLQLVVVLLTARVCGWLLKHIGQPGVVGEMAAGLVLGPVCMGSLFPTLHAELFSKASLVGLSALSTVGLVLFMFVVGLELRAEHGIRAQIKASSYVGALSVIVPLALGLAISPTLYPSLAPAGIGFWPFALFLAAALSITAFPVMARILKDRDMTHTRFGQLSLGSAAVVDVVAWIVLAFVVAIAGAGNDYRGLTTAGIGIVLLLCLVYWVFRPFFAHLLNAQSPNGEPTSAVLTALMIGLMVCAMLTEWLHLHAIFGAFLFGTCLPRDDRLLKSLVRRIEPISTVVLMPLFFALAGLSTTTDAFRGGGLGTVCLIVAVAVIGKVSGSAVGARFAGYNWSDSLATGALMNARGLMELIVIKVGLDSGLIGHALFTMLLCMALATTSMTGPLLTLFTRRIGKPTRVDDSEPLGGF